MNRLMCKGKIHRATVTEASLDYVGSITIDALLMKMANIHPYEMVQVTSLRNATRWKTYAIPAQEGSGKICLNGPPAHLFEPGDLVIILSMGLFDEEEVKKLVPKVVFVDNKNQITHYEDHPLFTEDGEVNWSGL
ncbi:aspartate 1-decarboxylase [Ammoniphilus sp. CFH 90114]|uniref:aspartate 1-decarboxylase n=1 Tax=Ammoniphilus sp. CFH 90114 TaxID=2493665 RepID=UPI00100DD2F0|nr:aspartate 1-decarboxylase [Ammoniphilus sp. CFH 90114]RXT07939.1 aspartate 1-decarboxylase [Ammoniphilus sp. CFH 90114]